MTLKIEEVQIPNINNARIVIFNEMEYMKLLTVFRDLHTSGQLHGFCDVLDTLQSGYIFDLNVEIEKNAFESIIDNIHSQHSRFMIEKLGPV